MQPVFTVKADKSVESFNIGAHTITNRSTLMIFQIKYTKLRLLEVFSLRLYINSTQQHLNILDFHQKRFCYDVKYSYVCIEVFLLCKNLTFPLSDIALQWYKLRKEFNNKVNLMISSFMWHIWITLAHSCYQQHQVQYCLKYTVFLVKLYFCT